MALSVGSVLGAYRIVRLLGEGGMGCVYEAEHVGLRVRRALKVFTTESEHRDLLRKRFAAEGRMLADLQHPRIVRVYDFAVDEATGAPYFAMDLVVSPGGEPQTLEDACRAGVDEDQVAGWFRDICEGLGYIHSKGVVHRDVSLDNILIDADGRAVIGDFGIAKITGEDYRRKIDVTVTMPLPPGEAMRWGKGLYLSPELKKGGEASPASDAYALGVLLFRLLVGSWYTSETKLADMLAGLECNWAEVIGRLCAEEPRERLPEEGVAAAPAWLYRRTHGGRTGRYLAAAAVAAAVLAAAVAVGLLRGRDGTQADPPSERAKPSQPGVAVRPFKPENTNENVTVSSNQLQELNKLFPKKTQEKR